MRPVKEPPLYGSGEICTLAGVTYRQLNWWRMRGYVTPSTLGRAAGMAPGKGIHLRWTSDDLARVKRIKAALDELAALGIGTGHAPI